MRRRLKSQMFFFIKTPLMKELLICNRINLLFLHLCVKSELEEQRSHKVVTVMSIEFDLFLLECAVRNQNIKKNIKNFCQVKNVLTEELTCSLFNLLSFDLNNFKISRFIFKTEYRIKLWDLDWIVRKNMTLDFLEH